MVFKTVGRLRVDMDNLLQTNTVTSVHKVSPASLKESHAGVEMWRLSGHEWVAKWVQPSTNAPHTC